MGWALWLWCIYKYPECISRCLSLASEIAWPSYSMECNRNTHLFCFSCMPACQATCIWHWGSHQSDHHLHWDCMDSWPIGWTGRRDNHLNEDATQSLSPVEARTETRKKERDGDHSGGVGDSTYSTPHQIQMPTSSSGMQCWRQWCRRGCCQERQ